MYASQVVGILTPTKKKAAKPTGEAEVDGDREGDVDGLRGDVVDRWAIRVLKEHLLLENAIDESPREEPRVP